MSHKYDLKSRLQRQICACRCLSWVNSIIGHLTVLIAALGVFGSAVTAVYGQSTSEPMRLLALMLVALPTLALLLEKSYRPSDWESWYARKALALEAIQRHVANDQSVETSDQLPREFVDWWNNVDAKFERTRPRWGLRGGDELDRLNDEREPSPAPASPTSVNSEKTGRDEQG